jgi:hypothetical protein
LLSIFEEKKMRNVLNLLLALCVSAVAMAAEPAFTTITRADDPLVKEIETGYAKYVAAARKGDLVAFRSLRTAARNAEIPPNATAKDLKGMADMLAPGLEGYKFQRLDTTGKMTRIAYSMEKKGELSIRVLMFEKDGAVWKAGDSADVSHIGQTPKLADAVVAALAKPEVKLAR